MHVFNVKNVRFGYHIFETETFNTEIPEVIFFHQLDGYVMNECFESMNKIMQIERQTESFLKQQSKKSSTFVWKN